MLKILCLLFTGLFTFVSCKDSEKSEINPEWKFVRTIKLNDITPTGLQAEGNFLWISDVKNNRVIKTNLNGEVVKEYSDIKRPMHLSVYNSKVFVPEYPSDKIIIIENGYAEEYPLQEKPEAPAGVFVNDSLIAVADFYNHRIVLQINNENIILGKAGHNKGELYYPTDLTIRNDKVYVADAYNNRVQVFDYKGNSLKVIGEKDKINVATGIEVTAKNIFVTDFEGSRILIYNLDGILIETLKDNFNHPTDVTYHNNAIFVSNYGDNTVSVIHLAD
ncbi:MAG: hypothetical protein HND52_17560 [Ignavibacteriae bacterium]|nr:hypothetical protein [Ignavibacteriota bacterium]NOG99771.1 hypothetical protein [Ignavibacteriota bacterium]